MKSITIQSIKGMEEVGLVKAFAINEINRKFAILTRKESLGDSMSKVYISEVLETPEGIKLVGITDESLWDKVKSSMKDIVQGNSNTLTVFDLNGKIVEEGFRIIGLKDADVEKLSTSESSFVMNKEEKQPEQVVSTPNNSTIPNEAVVAPVPEPKPVPEETPQVSETNIFDMPEPIVTPQSLNASGTLFSNTNLFDTPSPIPETAPQNINVTQTFEKETPIQNVVPPVNTFENPASVVTPSVGSNPTINMEPSVMPGSAPYSMESPVVQNPVNNMANPSVQPPVEPQNDAVITLIEDIERKLNSTFEETMSQLEMLKKNYTDSKKRTDEINSAKNEKIHILESQIANNSVNGAQINNPRETAVLSKTLPNNSQISA